LIIRGDLNNSHSVRGISIWDWEKEQCLYKLKMDCYPFYSKIISLNTDIFLFVDNTNESSGLEFFDLADGFKSLGKIQGYGKFLMVNERCFLIENSDCIDVYGV